MGATGGFACRRVTCRGVTCSRSSTMAVRAGEENVLLNLKKLGKRLKFRRGRHQALTGERVEIRFDRVGRILKPEPDFPHRAAKQPRRQMQVTAQKFVGVLNIDPVRGKRRHRKIFEILRHNNIAASRRLKAEARSPPRERDGHPDRGARETGPSPHSP
jgi:hypothetical protein